MSGGGEVIEEARKVAVSEKEVNTSNLSVEGIMDSVRNHEEEVKLNTPLPPLHMIPSYYSYPPLFTQVPNTTAEEAK